MLTEYILWTYSVCIRYLVLAYHGQSAAGCVLFCCQNLTQTERFCYGTKISGFLFKDLNQEKADELLRAHASFKVVSVPSFHQADAVAIVENCDKPLCEMIRCTTRRVPMTLLKENKAKRTKSTCKNYSIAVVATMSAGKSTLLNSIIGRDILPARNEACTSTIFQIEDDDRASEFTARFVGKKNMIEWAAIEKNILEEWNDKNPQKIEIRGNLPNINNIDGKYRVVFFDTPGPNNSLEDKHSKVVDKILHKPDYCAMLCVLNASVLGVTDEWKLLSHIQKVIAQRALDIQPIFVVNKIDLLDIEKGEDPVDILDKMKVYLKDLKFESPFLIPVSSKSSLFLRGSIKEKKKMTISEKLSESTWYKKIPAIFSQRFQSSLTIRQQKNLRDTITLYKDLAAEYVKMYSSFPEFRPILESLMQKRYPLQNRKIKIAGEYFLFKDFYQADILTGIPILERILEDNFNKYVCSKHKSNK